MIYSCLEIMKISITFLQIDKWCPEWSVCDNFVSIILRSETNRLKYYEQDEWLLHNSFDD